MKLDSFTQAYIDCALWSSTDNACIDECEGDNHSKRCGRETGGEPLDRNYSANDLSPECLKRMVEDCRAFQAHEETVLDMASRVDGLDYNSCKAGHDFWLTRNGHGVGFWDRGLGKVGDELTKASKAYGNADLYVGDDGMIHHG